MADSFNRTTVRPLCYLNLEAGNSFQYHFAFYARFGVNKQLCRNRTIRTCPSKHHEQCVILTLSLHPISRLKKWKQVLIHSVGIAQHVTIYSMVDMLGQTPSRISCFTAT